jgi:putative tricarboxylic transport membrane protein
MIAVRNAKDVVAGGLFVLCGFAALWFGRSLEYGTARQMGSGFIPRWLAAILVLLGIAIVLRGLVVDGGRMTSLPLKRTVTLIAAIVAFGATVEPLGLAISTFLCTAIGALAGNEIRRGEIVALGAGLAAFSGIVFVYGLRLPFSLWPAF